MAKKNEYRVDLWCAINHVIVIDSEGNEGSVYTEGTKILDLTDEQLKHYVRFALELCKKNAEIRSLQQSKHDRLKKLAYKIANPRQ